MLSQLIFTSMQILEDINTQEELAAHTDFDYEYSVICDFLMELDIEFDFTSICS